MSDLSEPEVPEMKKLEKRDFRTVTATGTALIKEVKATPDEEKLAVLIDGLESATKEYISIMLEKAQLEQILTHSPEGSFLYKLDFKGLFESNKSGLEKAQVKPCDFVLLKLTYVTGLAAFYGREYPNRDFMDQKRVRIDGIRGQKVHGFDDDFFQAIARKSQDAW